MQTLKKKKKKNLCKVYYSEIQKQGTVIKGLDFKCLLLSTEDSMVFEMGVWINARVSYRNFLWHKGALVLSK